MPLTVYVEPLPSLYIEVFEKTVAFHNNVNHWQAEYVRPHLVKPFRELL